MDLFIAQLHSTHHKIAREEGSNQGDAPTVGKKGNPTLGAGLGTVAAIATKLTAVQGPAMMVGTVFVCMSKKFVAIGSAELGFRGFFEGCRQLFSCTWMNNLFFLFYFTFIKLKLKFI
jgi:hypothetical protein